MAAKADAYLATTSLSHSIPHLAAAFRRHTAITWTNEAEAVLGWQLAGSALNESGHGFH